MAERPSALLLHGGPGLRVYTAARMPDATVRVLDSVGHFPWLERPGCVAHEVLDFVGTQPATPGKTEAR